MPTDKAINKRRRDRYARDSEYRKKVLETSKKYEKTKAVQEYRKTYSKTPKRIMMRTVRSWRNQGIKHSQDYLIKYYQSKYFIITNCEICNNEFSKCRKVLDHCHLSGSIRNTVCNKCNCQRASIDTKRYMLMLDLHRHFKRN